MSAMNPRPALLAAVLLCVTAARAQDAAPPEPDAAPAAETAEATAPPADAEPMTAPPTKATGPSPDTFRPSEEISEDLSVSFPVDI
jgi:hypothetical protein